MEKNQTATFAGGCFWCMEPPYEHQEGVEAAFAGYAGGKTPNPTYEKVAYGQTDHREAIQIHYDPSKVTYTRLVEIFWQNIDPTDPGGQFFDRGQQYKTAIFYQTEEEKKIAEESKKVLQASGKFDKPIVTEILPFTTFTPAEEKHQKYYLKNPTHYDNYKEGSGRGQFLRENWGK